MSQLVLDAQIDDSILRFDEHGLIPAIIQDVQTGQVLMLAYMNRESLKISLSTGETCFIVDPERSFGIKVQNPGILNPFAPLFTIAMKIHCFFKWCLQVRLAIRGSFLFYWKGRLGTRTNTMVDDGDRGQRPTDILQLLEQRVAQRAKTMPEGSYTTYLFTKGIDKILKKVGEETAEVIIGAKNRDASEVQYEVADLIYHLLVMLREQEISLDAILHELQRRYFEER